MNKPTHIIADLKVNRVLPTAELRSRKTRKNILKVTPITPKPARTV